MQPIRKKILYIITKSNWGGAQKYVFDLATNLPKNEFDVVVAAGGEGALFNKLTVAGIRTISIPSLVRDINTFKEIVSFFSLLKIILNEQPAIVHLNSAKASGLGALAARLANVPKIIFTAHGWAFNEDRGKPACLILEFISWITSLLSHQTIAVSDAVKRDTYGWPFVQKKIMVIKNGISVPIFLSRNEARSHLFARATIQIPEHAFVVGTIAELHKNKGLSYAIEAFAKLAHESPFLYYFIIGGGEEKERLQTLVNLHHLEKQVFLLGFVDDAALYLKALDVFLLPSITEGLALVVLEAGLANIPVIATNVGGIPEIITNGKTGLLVPPRDPEAIVKAIKVMRKSAIRTRSFGENLREHTLNNFSLTRTVKDTVTLYMKDKSDTI